MQQKNKQAKDNAKLCESASKIKELLDDTMQWLEYYKEASPSKFDKSHPVLGLLERYKQLENGK